MCYKFCPKGFYGANGVCQVCSSLTANCFVCSADSCILCNSGFVLVSPLNCSIAPAAQSNQQGQASLTKVAVKLKLTVTVAQAQAPAFQTAFIRSAAAAINVSTARIIITGVSAGSAFLTLEVLPDPTSVSSVSPLAAASDLVYQATVPTSSLSTQLVMNNLSSSIDTSFTPTTVTSTLCSDGVYRNTCPVATAAPSPSPSPSPSSSSGLSTTDTIVTAVLCGTAGLALLIALVWYFFLRTPTPAPTKSAEPEFSTVLQMEMQGQGKPQGNRNVV